MLSVNEKKLLHNSKNWYKAEKDEKVLNQQNLIDLVELDIIT